MASLWRAVFFEGPWPIDRKLYADISKTGSNSFVLENELPHDFTTDIKRQLGEHEAVLARLDRYMFGTG